MKVISYCIPAKNRSDEIIETLTANLAANRIHQDRIEFIVAIFDNNDDLSMRLHSEFGDDIASGYLKVHQDPRLVYWHFGRAKNAFKNVLSGNLYSSLDGDNYVSAEETAQIIDLYTEYGENLLFHHFSGSWGDGTCGRVTLSADRYRSVGYDERFLPRQFDEIDLMLSTVRTYPDTTYVSYFEKGVFGKSVSLSRFCDEENIAVRNRVVPDRRTRLPLNPKGELYVRDAAWLEPMQLFNIALSFLENSSTTQRKYVFSDRARAAGSTLVDKASDEDLSRWFFGVERSSIPEVKDGAIPVVACIRNEEEFLMPWYQHHKNSGAGPFLIIDDGSTTPIEDVLPFEDVFVFRPVMGSYLTCKATWLKAVLKCFVPENSWAITVDADEFLDLPSRWTSVTHYVKSADAAGVAAAPGLLIDMLPAPNKIGGEMGIDQFDRHLFDWSLLDASYRKIPSIEWAFGHHWNLSCVVDARYHLFGTVDVLRKIPLVKNVTNMEINQGFHDVATPDQKTVPHILWKSRFLLPIRHYKLMKLFKSDMRERLTAQASTPCVYHSRTTANFGKMLSVGESELQIKLRNMKLAKYNPNFIFSWKMRLLGMDMSRYFAWDMKTCAETLISRVGFLRKRKGRLAEAGKRAAVLLFILLSNGLGDLTALDAIDILTD